MNGNAERTITIVIKRFRQIVRVDGWWVTVAVAASDSRLRPSLLGGISTAHISSKSGGRGGGVRIVNIPLRRERRKRSNREYRTEEEECQVTNC